MFSLTNVLTKLNRKLLPNLLAYNFFNYFSDLGAVKEKKKLFTGFPQLYSHYHPVNKHSIVKKEISSYCVWVSKFDFNVNNSLFLVDLNFGQRKHCVKQISTGVSLR